MSELVSTLFALPSSEWSAAQDLELAYKYVATLTTNDAGNSVHTHKAPAAETALRTAVAATRAAVAAGVLESLQAAFAAHTAAFAAYVGAKSACRHGNDSSNSTAEVEELRWQESAEALVVEPAL